jgi:hypothetical protein
VTNATIEVTPPVACVGDTLTFTVSGVTDTGGVQRVLCTVEQEVAPATPTYTWVITKPDGTPVQGSGESAVVTADLPGTYSCTFTAFAERECDPPALNLDPATASTIDVNLTLGGLPEDDEEQPGGFLCVNNDDDNNDGTPDKDDAGATPGEDDLIALTVSGEAATGTLELSAVFPVGSAKLYQGSDRTGLIALPMAWTLPSPEIPATLYVEGVGASAALADVEFELLYTGDGTPCNDRVRFTVLGVALDPVTSGIDPVPDNPAVVAPMTPLPLGDGTLFWDANTFELTNVQPDVDLSALPVDWTFNVSSGSLNATAAVVPAADRRSARLQIPFPSWGNLGTGSMEFRVNNQVCASAETLIKNVQPDLEPGDFRFQVKAHLCTDGQGTSTTRTEPEVRAIMCDVTKVLSQCGIIVTLNGVVTTVVPTEYIDDLDSGSEKTVLFGYEEDDSAIDVYFVKLINSGGAAGVTLTPSTSTFWEPGVAIADGVGTDGAVVLEGQYVVRTLSHEVTHYLLNSLLPESSDHREDDENLMYWDTVDTKRDLDLAQCIEIRTNSGGE